MNKKNVSEKKGRFSIEWKFNESLEILRVFPYEVQNE